MQYGQQADGQTVRGIVIGATSTEMGSNIAHDWSFFFLIGTDSGYGHWWQQTLSPPILVVATSALTARAMK